MQKHSIINDRQFGFSKNRGCNDALYFISDFIYTNLDNNSPTIESFHDISKAFDTVCPNRFIDKLNRLSIRDTSLLLIKNYLLNRTQFIRIGDTRSEITNVSIGVL